jgi:FkbM family methyltransferase
MIKKTLGQTTGALLRFTGLQYFPVRVRAGIAAGARWTLYPWTSYWRSTQEPAMHHALVAVGDIHGWSCWDLGAHYGIYSIGLARRVGPTGEVAAFEPNPLSYARLERHRAMNGLTWLKTFNAAVSATSAVRELYTGGQLETTSTHLRYDDEIPIANSQSVQVQTLALDELVAVGRIRPPRLIKIDVEGHGHHALAGARQTLRSALPIIVMGFHSAAEVEGTERELNPLGYTWEPVEPAAGPDRIGQDFLLRPPVKKN